jgi:hypothetical protein
VTITGPGTGAALERLRQFLPMIGIEFSADAARSGQRSGIEVESFKGRVDTENFLNVQFLQSSSGATPILSVQLFATKE